MKYIILLLMITTLYAGGVKHDQFKQVLKAFERTNSLVGKKAKNLQFLLGTGRLKVQFTMPKELSKARLEAIKKLFNAIELDDGLVWDFKIQQGKGYFAYWIEIIKKQEKI